MNAFSAQSAASFGKNHTPNILRSSVLDACFFNVGAIQTGGALIRPCPVGVNLSGAGTSLPDTALFAGTGETLVRGTPEAYMDTISFTGPDDSLVVGRNDLILASLNLFGLSEQWVTLVTLHGGGEERATDGLGALYGRCFKVNPLTNLQSDSSEGASRERSCPCLESWGPAAKELGGDNQNSY